jgi:phosphate transport system permease protein
MLSAGLVMGIMIIPYVSSLSEDAMRAVPMSLREGSYAMGATRCRRRSVVVPAALSGIASAYILGISRAVGETMILAVAAGMQPNLTFNPPEPAPRSPPTSCRWRSATCRTARSATRPSSPPA